MLRETIIVEAVDCPANQNKLGIDMSPIYIYTKDKVEQSDQLLFGVHGPQLYIQEVTQREIDGIFSHYKLTCAIVTQDPGNTYIPVQHLKRGTFLIVNQ